MQAELLMVLTCAGYVAPYAWDRYLWRIWDELLISDEELALRMHRLELPDGSYLNVPARLEFRELSLAENRQLTESMANAMQNAGRSVILTQEIGAASGWCASENPGYVFLSESEAWIPKRPK